MLWRPAFLLFSLLPLNVAAVEPAQSLHMLPRLLALHCIYRPACFYLPSLWVPSMLGAPSTLTFLSLALFSEWLPRTGVLPLGSHANSSALLGLHRA